MKTRPITVAETQAFTRSAEKIWSEEERAELVDYVAHNPEAGDVIRHWRCAKAALGTIGRR